MRIAVSGFGGAGITSTAQAVARILGLKPIVYTLRDIAKEERISMDEMNALKVKEFPKWDHILDGKLINAAVDGTILSTDIAIWLVHADLRVWIHAPLKTRARRTAERDWMEYKEALRKVGDCDKSFAAHFKRLYRIDWKKFYDVADIVVNNERVDLESVADIIVNATKRIPLRENKAMEKKVDRIRNIILNGAIPKA